MPCLRAGIAMSAIAIDSGHYGDARLDGLKIGAVFH
jgi:hypothetical protein